jgi:hypothetical protein
VSTSCLHIPGAVGAGGLNLPPKASGGTGPPVGTTRLPAGLLVNGDGTDLVNQSPHCNRGVNRGGLPEDTRVTAGGITADVG